MEEFLLRQNIAHYRHLLATTVSGAARQTIAGLLSQEEKKLAQLLRAKQSDVVERPRISLTRKEATPE